MRFSATAAVVGGATVAGVYALTSVLRRRQAEDEAGDDDVEDLCVLKHSRFCPAHRTTPFFVWRRPEVPPEVVVQIFGKLCGLMNAHLTQVMRRINAQGAQVPQQMLAQYLVEHFEQQLRELQTRVFAEFGVTEDALEEAVEYYEAEPTPGAGPRDARVVEATNQLRQLYINVGGSIDLDLPADLTVDKMCAVFDEYMAAVVAAQHAFTEHLHAIKARGASVTTTDLQEARQAKIQEKVGVVLKKHGLNALVFQAALEKFNDHPTFQAAVQAVKAKEVANASNNTNNSGGAASGGAASSSSGGRPSSRGDAAGGGSSPATTAGGGSKR